MLDYQLDKCNNNRALCARCIEEGLARIFRFSAMEIPDNAADSDVFDSCQAQGRVLLTNDGTFHSDNASHISEPHHGIVIVSTAAHKPLTSKMVMATLAKFKAAFPLWHHIAPRNAILFLTEEWAELYRVVDGREKLQERFQFQVLGWQHSLAEWLEKLSQ